MPYLFLFQVVLPAIAPLVDLLAIYGLVFLDAKVVISAWLAFALVQLAIAAYAFVLDGEPLRPLWAVPLQQIVYRQLMYLVVIQSLFSAATGVRLHWQKLRRIGIPPPSQPDAVSTK